MKKKKKMKSEYMKNFQALIASHILGSMDDNDISIIELGGRTKIPLKRLDEILLKNGDIMNLAEIIAICRCVGIDVKNCIDFASSMAEELTGGYNGGIDDGYRCSGSDSRSSDIKKEVRLFDNRKGSSNMTKSGKKFEQVKQKLVEKGFQKQVDTWRDKLVKVSDGNIPKIKEEFLGCWSRYKMKIVKSNDFPEDLAECPEIISGSDVWKLMKDIANYDREHLFAIHVNAEMRLMGIEEISVGTTGYSIIIPNMLFRGAIITGAHGIIMVHNHSYGSLKISKEDFESFRAMERLSRKLIQPLLLDSIIINSTGFVSIRGALQKKGERFRDNISFEEILKFSRGQK